MRRPAGISSQRARLSLPEPGKGYTVNGEPGQAGPPHANAVDAQGDGEALVDIVLGSAETTEVASAIKALVPLLPLDLSQEIAVDKRALALIAAGEARHCPGLAEAIALFVYERARYNSIFARPYIPALLSFLDYDIGTTGAYSYYTLIVVARKQPEYLQPYAGALIRMLDSRRDANKAFGAKIIAAIAREHPEYVVGALRALKSLSRDSPQPIVRKAAEEAFETLDQGLNREGRAQPAAGVAGTSDAGNPRPISGVPARPSADSKVGGVKPIIARLREKVDRLIRLKLLVSLQLIGLAGDNDEMSVVLGQFSEIAPWIKAVCRPHMVAAGDREPTPSPAAAIDDAAAIKLIPSEFCKLTTPNLAAIKVAEPQAPVLAVEALDETQIAELQRMMDEIKQGFTSSADSVLSTMGLSHLKPGNVIPGEGGGRTMSSKEFVQAIELILKEQSRQKAQGTAGASATAEADGGSAGKTGDHQPTQPAEGASITRLFSMLESKKMAADEP